jgi:hypothetical protein
VTAGKTRTFHFLRAEQSAGEKLPHPDGGGGVPRKVTEMAFARAVENKVEAAYRRGDLFQKRRQLMEALATFCAGRARGKPATNLVSMQKAPTR